MDTINNREDISKLVHEFYSKVRKNDVLGPIFNKHIPEDKWPEHLEKLTDFWEANLLGTAKFNGNPSAKHKNVDASMNYQIQQTHFGVWLQLWFKTIDQLFEGELAEKAKRLARKMATGQFLTIWHNRPENKKTNIIN